MRNSLLIMCVIVALSISANGQAALEQYCYVQNQQPVVLVPVFYMQNKSNWRIEARYNYEELRSGSIYVGKKISRENKEVSWAVTPLAGLVVGKFTGGSLGVNMEVQRGKLFFCSQSQFSFTHSNAQNNFIFSWSELVLEPWPWIFFGTSLQYLKGTNRPMSTFEKGVVVGLNFRKWSFPVYAFNLTNGNRYFIIGVNIGVGVLNKHE
jgi:hypothetical protein